MTQSSKAPTSLLPPGPVPSSLGHTFRTIIHGPIPTALFETIISYTPTRLFLQAFLAFFMCIAFTIHNLTLLYVLMPTSQRQVTTTKSKSFTGGKSRQVVPERIPYSPDLDLRKYTSVSEPVIITGLPPHFFKDLSKCNPLKPTPTPSEATKGKMYVHESTFPVTSYLGDFIYKATSKIVIYLLCFRGDYTSGYCHIDSFPTTNCYCLFKGAKDVILVPIENSPYLDCVTGFDSVYIKNSSGMDMEWVDQVPWHYRFTLNEGEVLFFDNGTLFHKFINIETGEQPLAYSLRCNSGAAHPVAAWKDVLSLRNAWAFADVIVSTTLVERDSYVV
ncbi:hypothetical protein HDV05_004591 [Chytridiales sp. JEL 0842]|nr:hypothetical protein HDV05_004591 [Chytridiales sp. JEL 0842]